MKLENVGTFVAIADAGSLSAAARAANLSKSVVSERLAELERSLGAQLVQRTSRKLSLTGDGMAFLARARRILAEADAARAELSERRGELAGPLRISAPVSFGTLHLGRALFPFLRAHPRIELTLELDDQRVDVLGQGYDAVIRHSRIADARVIAKRIASSERYFVASPEYLRRHGLPRSPTELASHTGILYTLRDPDWRLRVGHKHVVVRPERCLRLNNGMMMRDAAVAGLGIALVGSFLVQQELSKRLLTRIDVGGTPESAEVFVAYASSRAASAKIRALVECLRGAFGDPPATK
ncbi:MAG TPA: LysR substrate-binding domain-containing protein [Usitatibacter sp.]|jgi:DNA-binding transcriptional LysR family regulator|nr:LysR substrate-binding domain-containing protein [Usitatibacter sp.]